MLTTKDINNILTAVEKVFNRSMDEKLRPLTGQLADFRREFREFKQEMQEFRGDMEEFKQKMYEFQKEMYEFKGEMYEFKDEMTEFRDQTQKILENIFDDLQTKHDTEKQFKSRLADLEQIHPDGQHLPAFKTLS